MSNNLRTLAALKPSKRCCRKVTTTRITGAQYTFGPQYMHDGGRRRLRHPSRLQHRLRRTSFSSGKSEGPPRGLRRYGARCSRPPQCGQRASIQDLSRSWSMSNNRRKSMTRWTDSSNKILPFGQESPHWTCHGTGGGSTPSSPIMRDPDPLACCTHARYERGMAVDVWILAPRMWTAWARLAGLAAHSPTTISEDGPASTGPQPLLRDTDRLWRSENG